MMLFKRFITPNTLSKVIKNPPASSSFFKQMDWSVVKKNRTGTTNKQICSNYCEGTGKYFSI
ncbi:Uncharacterised protein [Legionella sainthelensi]|uniref:hypothetical protein n=1 Tax=Legionella sainthelensi TaxID=28087 RepID=UPI000F71B459|nr:hypothetical protein [Legionella sainthelensi]VEB35969.1 Uncharacterised protein [Legionella sainthelensi]